MARSRRKNPGCGTTTAASDKPFKQQEHRRERAALRDGRGEHLWHETVEALARQRG